MGAGPRAGRGSFCQGRVLTVATRHGEPIFGLVALIRLGGNPRNGAKDAPIPEKSAGNNANLLSCMAIAVSSGLYAPYTVMSQRVRAA